MTDALKGAGSARVARPGRSPVVRLALLLAGLLVVFGVGVEIGRAQVPPAADPPPVDPVISVEWEAADGDRSERISVQAPEPIAREIFETVIERREASAPQPGR